MLTQSRMQNLKTLVEFLNDYLKNLYMKNVNLEVVNISKITSLGQDEIKLSINAKGIRIFLDNRSAI